MPFSEIADRVWVARYDWFDVNVSLIAGESGLVVVDTHASGAAATEVLEDIRALGLGPVTAVVNTHEHFDHTFGNATFRAEYDDVAIYAHEVAAENTVAAGERVKKLYADGNDPHRDEVLGTEITPAGTTFSSVSVIDLGDRVLELIHPGRGHTGGDLVVRVPDADVLLAGDLIEESDSHDAVPGFGADCYPLEWPLSLDIVLGLTGAASVVVPGHGGRVDRDFVEIQRNNIGVVAETIRDLATRGVPASQALDAADWPFPKSELEQAVVRAYEQLPRSQKRLPLV